MAVSSTTGGLRTGVCLSTDRPQNPYNGQVIYETDTNRTLVWDNSAWVVIHDPTLMSYSGTGVTVTADAATIGGENVTPYTGRRNLLFNGAMQVAQRGTSANSVTTNNYHTVDRWRQAIGSMGTWTLSKEADGPSGFSSSAKFLCTTADATPASGDYLFFSQRIEGQDLQQVKKGTSSAEQLTISFWVKSNVTGTYVVELRDEDNSRHVGATYSVVASGTWEKKTITFPADTTGVFDNDAALSLELAFWLGAGTNFTSGTLPVTWGSLSNANRAAGVTNLAAATNNYWQITGVQLEVGNKATPFEHRRYQDELIDCMRYYQTDDCRQYGSARTQITDNHRDFTVRLPVPMRATLTSGDVSVVLSNTLTAWVDFSDKAFSGRWNYVGDDAERYVDSYVVSKEL